MPKTFGAGAHAASYHGPQDPARLRVAERPRESLEEFRARMAEKAAQRAGFRRLHAAGLDVPRGGARVHPDRAAANAERTAALAAAYQAGASVPDLAAEYGLTPKHLVRVLSQAGVPMRRNPTVEAARRAELVPQVVAAYGAGAHVPDLATRFDVTATTIRGWLRDAGVTLRDDRRPQPPGPDLPQILTAYTAGQTIDALAATYHHQKAVIRRWILDAGVILRDDRTTNSGSTPKTAADDDPAVAALVVDAYTQGATLQAIAAQVPGVGSVKHATGILRRAGVPLRRARSVSTATPQMLERARAMRAQGATQQAIADELGVCQNTVSRYLRGVSRAATPASTPATPQPTAPTAPRPQPPDVGDLNERLVAVVTDLLTAADRLEHVLSDVSLCRHEIGRARLAAAGLLAHLPIPTPHPTGDQP